MHISRRQSLSLLASLPLAGFGMSACSFLGLGSSPTSPADAMKLNVAVNSGSTGFFPVYVGLQQGYFSGQGLTLTPNPPAQSGTGAVMTAGIESGNYEFCIGGLITDFFTLSRIDSSVRLLGAHTTGYFADVIASNSFLAQTGLSESSSLADKVNALRGKKIGITAPGSGTSALLIYLFRQQGLDAQRDVTMVSLGSASAAALAALKAGHVDALSFFSPAVQVAVAQGIGQPFISPERGDVPEMMGQVHGVFYTKQSVIDAKPNAVQAVIRAIAQAQAFIHANPTQTAALMEKYTKLSAKVSSAVLSEMLPVYPQSPQISQQGYNTAAAFHVKAGLITIAPAYNTVVATSTINDALKNFSA